MFHRKTLGALLVAAMTLAPLSALADTAHPPCVLREHRITSVAPYSVDQHVGRGVVKKLLGAQVQIQAEPGLTAEWLQLNLGRHLAAMRTAPMKDCAFGVNDVRVRVDSAGPGFSVKLIATDSANAQEVLRRAKLLAR